MMIDGNYWRFMMGDDEWCWFMVIHDLICWLMVDYLTHLEFFITLCAKSYCIRGQKMLPMTEIWDIANILCFKCYIGLWTIEILEFFREREAFYGDTQTKLNCYSHHKNGYSINTFDFSYKILTKLNSESIFSNRGYAEAY